MTTPELGVILPSMTAHGRLPGDLAAAARHADVDAIFGGPADPVGAVLLRLTPDELASTIAAYGDAGASRPVISVAGGDWYRQTELVGEARTRLP
ncbi:MAG: hypothetical protein JO023_01360 [Chloroflexi bacterium]|nr:hypothetical protein [Chloroflexota bacterium]